MRRRFATLDVFTGRRFAGNPLAVVLEADGLDAAAMQAIAREFNHPESVFVFPSADPRQRARLRIFTPATELPFAGHPTVGTAVLLARADRWSAADVVLAEEIGPVRCRVSRIGNDQGAASFEVPRLPAAAGTAPATQEVAGALGLAADDIGFDRFVPARWSAGVPFTFIPVRSLAAIGRARLNPVEFERAFGRDGPAAAYLFCRETAEPGHAFHARMFAPAMGIVEDPATGSAAAALSGMVLRYGGHGDGEHTFIIEQGYEMGRPSQITLTAAFHGDAVVKATIGGEAVVVTEGTLEA